MSILYYVFYLLSKMSKICPRRIRPPSRPIPASIVLRLCNLDAFVHVLRKPDTFLKKFFVDDFCFVVPALECLITSYSIYL